MFYPERPVLKYLVDMQHMTQIMYTVYHALEKLTALIDTRVLFAHNRQRCFMGTGPSNPEGYGSNLLYQITKISSSGREPSAGLVQEASQDLLGPRK